MSSAGQGIGVTVNIQAKLGLAGLSRGVQQAAQRWGGSVSIFGWGRALFRRALRKPALDGGRNVGWGC
jgi:hypothetical protein